jgi:DNA-binding CsgD family transcriptional regulator
VGRGPKVAEIENLSDRELQVFELIGRGETTRSIAARLQVSVHTVESHRENLRAKLNLRTGSELVQRAVQWVLENG